ncbi:alpha/beta hydrolase [Micromonospora sp. NPDC023737]|uniref:alpha/beta fold hydrolase n=1 Tax=unclassified Micromonospora TaxID=2617518 RepID=UPI0033E8E7F6
MTTYILIPGAGGAAWYWHRLVPLLHQRGHEAIAVDLPAGDDNAGLQEYADTVVDAAGQRKDLVVVAQSMGGLTAPLVCGRLPVSRLVLVNAMIPAPGESGRDWWTNNGQEQARRECDLREGRLAEGPFDPLVYFFHDVPEDITEEAMAGESPQSGTPFEQPWPLDAWPGVPTEVLSSREDRLFPVEFQIRIAQHRLGVTPKTLPGGHLVALSQPEALAAALER